MYIDTHLDTLWQSTKSDRTFTDRSEDGHVDLPRSREGGLFLGFFTGFPTENQYATERMMSRWIQFFRPENSLTRIKSKRGYFDFKDKWEKNDPQREIGAVLHFEGAAGIDTELNRLYIYHDLGLRSMSLTWNEQNQFATGVKGEKERGLTTEGKDLLDAMDQLGIIVDVSHLNDTSFWDVAEHGSGPLIASHSNVRSIADHPRNLTPSMISAIVDTGGTIGVNFCKIFLTSDQENDPADRYRAISMMEKIMELGSIENVHIGSDFDGCQTPDDIGDVTAIPAFLNDLQNRLDLKNSELEQVAFKNMERIISRVWT